MSSHSPDVTYAYAHLGLAFGASLEEIGAVLVHARAYKYSTRQRVQQVERLVEFLAARDQFGNAETPFELIRRVYLKRVMTLHPDRNRDNKEAEEQLKLINIAFALIDAVRREARDYYRQSETARREIEDEARAATEREKPLQAKEKRTQQENPKQPDQTERTARPEQTREKAAGASAYSGPGKKYFAASIPRFIRSARLSYVPANCIIASWHIAQKNDVNFIYDVIMLPEREFLRARMHLATPDVATPTLSRGGFSPAYMPKDIKTVTVPEGEAQPEKYAKEHLLEQFQAEGKGKQ